MSLRAGLGIDDIDAVAALGHTCDRLGLDVISAGTAVAWAIRAADEGVLDADHTLSFGHADAAESVLRAIGTRDDPLGDLLADGVDAAAECVGGTDLVPSVKAMAAPGYDRGPLPPPRWRTRRATGAPATAGRSPARSRSSAAAGGTTPTGSRSSSTNRPPHLCCGASSRTTSPASPSGVTSGQSGWRPSTPPPRPTPPT
jgi:hypothetical protein